MAACPSQSPLSPALTVTFPASRAASQPGALREEETRLSQRGLGEPNNQLLSPHLTRKVQVRKAGAEVLWKPWAKGPHQEFNQPCLSPGSSKRQTALVKQESNFPSRRLGAFNKQREPVCSSPGPLAWLIRLLFVRSLLIGRRPKSGLNK